MTIQRFKLSSLVGYALMVSVSVLSTPVSVRADSVQLTELMIEVQGAQVELFAAAFGLVPGTSLTFNSNVDLSAMTFSYSLVPGSTYGGQPLTFSGSAEFNSTTGVLTVAGSGVFDAISFAMPGNQVATDNKDMSFYALEARQVHFRKLSDRQGWQQSPWK
jgi:hypothetical protein